MTWSIVWRRLDTPGHEASRLWQDGAEWRVAGTAALVLEEQPCRLDYAVTCGADWRTRSATVTGWVGSEPVAVELKADDAGRWRLNGVEQPVVAGCLDVDLGFSPCTNLLPIRRLGLAVGEGADVRAAWLGFPGLELEPLPQRYTRTGPGSFRYESAGGSFVAALEVNPQGMVTRYGDLWQAEAQA